MAAAAAAGLVVVPATLAGAQASFSATTANPGNALATAQLQAPSNLSAVQTCTSTPTITHRAATGVGGTTSVSVPVPTGTTTGDLVVAQVAYRDGAETITAPSGWTSFLTTSSGSSITSALYWKVATASEPSAVFSRPAGSPGDMAVVLVSYVGARLAAPTGSGAAGAGTTATAPSVTTTGTTVEVVRILTKAQEYLPVPTGTTSLYQGVTGSTATTVGVTAADETFAGPGTTVTRSATSTSANAQDWTAQTIRLRRVAGTPSATLSWTTSPSTWATGYELTRLVGGTTLATQTVPGVTSTSTPDGPLTDATTYTYRLTTARGTWRSPPASTTLTTNC